MSVQHHLSKKRSACFGLALVVSLFYPALVFSEQGESNPTSEQNKLFSALEKNLSGATLVGHFTITGEDVTNLKQERYELKTVRHVAGDQWLFQARIKYGEHDVTLPLTVPVRWAGDTPIISIDKLPIPGLGTFTARVMIYADHYAGFWSGGDHGGHLFGIVEHPKDEKAAIHASKP